MTITNVDAEVAADELAPYEWSFQDAEALTYADGSFDLTVVSAGLHHCRSPHRALLELYRVARVAALALESRDTSLMRVAVKLGAVDEYELAAVAAHGLRSGGVAQHEHAELRLSLVGARGREDGRLVRAARPPSVPLLPRVRAAGDGARNRPGRPSARAPPRAPVVGGVTRVFPRQANLFAFAIEKPHLPDDLQPWMRFEDGELRPDPEVVGRRYETPSELGCAATSAPRRRPRAGGQSPPT